MDVIQVLTFCFGFLLAYTMEESVPKRFESTVDFILDQIINDAFDDELTNVPKSFKRNTIEADTSSECSDWIGRGRCKYLHKWNACKKNKLRMKKYCKKSCGWCASVIPPCNTRHYGCCPGSKELSGGMDFKGCADQCHDKLGKYFCMVARRLSFCSDRNHQMLLGCMKTCDYCRTCTDEKPVKCRLAKRYKACGQLRLTANDCRKTCGYCGKKDPCFRWRCPNLEKCVVDIAGNPTCVCKRKCNAGDYLTGIVCGRDGVEYQNLCKLKQMLCWKNKLITVKKYGSCVERRTDFKNLNCMSSDKDRHRCKEWVRSGACTNKFKYRMARSCPWLCGFCVASHPKPPCYYTTFGCCADGKTRCTSTGCTNCNTECKDERPIMCKRFTAACGQERNRLFMKNNCPKTCNYCSGETQTEMAYGRT